MAPGRIKSALIAAALGLCAAPAAHADEADVLAWSKAAARGLLQLCIQDAPDAARVAEHGEAWGWPAFMGYTEHPQGYKREAGGESRRTFQDGDRSAYVQATVQSGEVTSAAPANVAYFRCLMASDHAVGADLAGYFTGLYGPPAADNADGMVWLTGAAKGASPVDDDATLKAVVAAGPGAEGARIELTHEDGADRASLTMFRNLPAS